MLVPAVVGAVTMGLSANWPASGAEKRSQKRSERAVLRGQAERPAAEDPVASPVKLPTDVGARTEWCQTELRWRKKAGVHGAGARACPTEGTCDTPSVRDSWTPGGSDPITTLRIKFNVFCNSDGSNCAATQSGADAQLAQLNSDYLPSRIQWTATTQFINNSTYRDFSDSEESAMKSTYADSPATQLNVYVVNILGGYLGVGTFPWDPDATGTQGGIIIDDGWFGSGQKTLTHEAGHNVGLWHTHHGVSEVATCSACWERADGVNGDTTGDFASDTAPTPTNYNCSDPGGTDTCSGTPWGATDPQNYMSYAPDSCYTEFSSQQWGRENCWIDDQLTGWIEAPCIGDPECNDGKYCNGTETCVGGSCQPGTSPCGGAPCDEATDTCSTLAYEWNMNTDPGWSTAGQWAWGQPTGGGGQYGGPDPTSGATGSNVYGYNLNGDYANSLAETNLTSTAIDCSSLTSVTLQFQRWLGVEQPAYDHAYVRVSNNGSIWTTVWENTSEVADSAWSLKEYDISAVADNQPTVYLRWTMGTTDGSWQYCGWNIDDIQLYAFGGGPTCSDGIQNQGEDRIDCGGPCPACQCTSDPACDDGAYCNGAEACDAYGNCQSGTAVDCSDGVGCTDDSCNEGTDSCDNIANDANCDDALWCNGSETCDAVNDCQAGTAPNCDDGVACTDDSCSEGTDSCDNVANDANCDDGQYCNGAETCDALLDCQPGTAVDCDDGLFCNGAETCVGGSCQAGSDPCPGQGCDEVGDVCVPLACNDNGACESGEDCNTCPNDCISGGGAGGCGNGVCEPTLGEDCVSCSSDCSGKQVGATKRQFCCGDGDGVNPVGCDDSRCTTDPWACSDTPPDPYCCGDGTCEGAEDSLNCEVDCGPPPVCGDTFCDPGEDQCTCPADCCASAPPTESACADGCDNDCDGLTDGADPDCICGAKGDPCTVDTDCCSFDCKTSGTCK